mmetsp:Transcript_21247/g.66527  ORF Transcript_21247/g.66527 Transcript_21247/m.66527 type:complete len:220 (-) Transcript_21247:52-711(-)
MYMRCSMMPSRADPSACLLEVVREVMTGPKCSMPSARSAPAPCHANTVVAVTPRNAFSSVSPCSYTNEKTRPMHRHWPTNTPSSMECDMGGAGMREAICLITQGTSSDAMYSFLPSSRSSFQRPRNGASSSGEGEPDAAEAAGDSLARASRAEFACSSMMRTAATAVKEAESEWRCRLSMMDARAYSRAASSVAKPARPVRRLDSSSSVKDSSASFAVG